MPSILSGFDTVQQALAAQQFALSITQKNVANANNPNYTRQDVVNTGDETEWVRSGVPGVTLRATRDRFLDYSISQELQSLAEYNVASDALGQIDSILNGSGEGLQQAISHFFNGFASLSSSPEDLTLRQNVLSSAEALSREFQRLYGSIQQVQTSQDQALNTAVEEINSITAQIAQWNVKVREAQGAHSPEADQGRSHGRRRGNRRHRHAGSFGGSRTRARYDILLLRQRSLHEHGNSAVQFDSLRGHDHDFPAGQGELRPDDLEEEHGGHLRGPWDSLRGHGLLQLSLRPYGEGGKGQIDPGTLLHPYPLDLSHGMENPFGPGHSLRPAGRGDRGLPPVRSGAGQVQDVHRLPQAETR